MTLVVEEDEPPNPADVGFFGAQTLAVVAQARSVLVEFAEP
jgi:hypothetical protein